VASALNEKPIRATRIAIGLRIGGVNRDIEKNVCLAGIRFLRFIWVRSGA
jgi:hypothetical protein